MSEPEVIKYILTQDQVNSIAAIASQEGARAYKEEAKKAEKKLAKQTDKVEITKKRLRDYRAVKKKTTEEVFSSEELEELRFEYLEDLMGQHGLEGKAEKKRDAELWAYILNADSIKKIDKAYKQYEEECERWGTEEQKRRCRILHMMYMDDTVYSVEEIAEMENIAERSVYRDTGIAVKRMAAYLLGF